LFFCGSIAQPGSAPDS